MRDQAERVLGPIRAFVEQQGWKVQTDYSPGSAVQSIVEKAEALKPDLIVMGTHGRSPVGSFVLGSGSGPCRYRHVGQAPCCAGAAQSDSEQAWRIAGSEA